MYSEYFGLDEIPFSIAPDPRYLYMSEQHREALAHLTYGFNSDGGFVLLTGEVGTGKTTVCRCMLEQVPEGSSIAFILNPKLTVEELLATVCDEFGIPYPQENRSTKIFVDLINSYLFEIHGKGGRAVLIIDEAQNLSADVLEELRLLTNLETNKRKLLQIILLGQPELREKLSKPELRQLSQRIIARYHLGPLSKKDVASYVTHRLTIAGIQKEIFPSSTINNIYKLSGGVPRLINVLCDRALLGTFVQKRKKVSNNILKKAAGEVFEKPGYLKPQRRITAWLLPVMTVLLAAGIIFLILRNNKTDNVAIYKPILLPAESAPERLEWPDSQPADKGGEIALKTVFRQWGINYEPRKDMYACRQARTFGLRCLSSSGNLADLRKLDRPAILKLSGENRPHFFAALTSLGKETATLVVSDKTLQVALSDLESKWSGSYTLLWKMPPGFQGNIMPGSRGPAVKWLDKELSAIYGKDSKSVTRAEFDKEFAEEVKMFQVHEGLVPDGIVGAKTVIHINTLTDRTVPKLTVEKKAG